MRVSVLTCSVCLFLLASATLAPAGMSYSEGYIQGDASYSVEVWDEFMMPMMFDEHDTINPPGFPSFWTGLADAYYTGTVYGQTNLTVSFGLLEFSGTAVSYCQAQSSDMAMAIASGDADFKFTIDQPYDYELVTTITRSDAMQAASIVLRDSDYNTLAANEFTGSGNAPQTLTFTGTLPAGTYNLIAFESANYAEDQTSATFNYDMTLTEVPEPASSMLLVIGGLGLALCRRR